MGARGASGARVTARGKCFGGSGLAERAGRVLAQVGSALQKPESKRNARKTDRSSCKHHFMFKNFLTSLISTIDKRMVDNIYTRREDSRAELKIRTKS